LRICLFVLPTTVALGVATLVLQSMAVGLEPWKFLIDPQLSYIHPVWLATFADDVIALVDWHLGLSMFLVTLSALQSPAAGLKGFFEACWLVLVAYLCATAAALVYDYMAFQVVQRLESSFGVWSMMAWSRSPQ